MDLSTWNGAPRPVRTVLEGAYARLESLDFDSHGGQLLHSARQEGAEARFRYLFDMVPADEESFAGWMDGASVRPLCASIPRMA